MAPEVSQEKGSFASRFYRWSLESFKSCLLILGVFPGLIITPLHSCWLETTKLLDTELFPQHHIADLNSGITFVVLFSQWKPLP